MCHAEKSQSTCGAKESEAIEAAEPNVLRPRLRVRRVERGGGGGGGGGRGGGTYNPRSWQALASS